ncbi:hypothetical protein vseg_020047 [Gypsophila vaccaria]
MVFGGLRSCLLLLAIAAAQQALLVPVGARNTSPFPAVFNFGDSISDTGSFSATFGRVPYPCGMTFFGKSSGRVCDGRLIIDFIAEKLGLPYLSAYLDAMAANFTHGANFAVIGSTLKPVDGKLYEQDATPLSLNIQLLQFQQFKDRVEELYKQGEIKILQNRLPKPEDFSKALYTIDMGSNDIAMLSAVGFGQARKSLPDLIIYFAQAIEKLYRLGARRFLIHNIGPLGCLPAITEMYQSYPEKWDEIGCVRPFNQVVQEFNQLLKAKASELRTKHQDLTLFYVDMYSAKYSLSQDANQHGFIDPLGYCCKDCRKYYMPLWTRDVVNETVVYEACDDPSKYISWDGSHYTEAANHWLANQIFHSSLQVTL